METHRAYARPWSGLSEEALEALLAEQSAELAAHPHWGYWESLLEYQWLEAPSPEAFDLARIDEGRLFGSDRELRWERTEEGCNALLVVDAAPPSEGSAQPLEPVGGPVSHFLWGTWEGDGWREGRIPEDLRYPPPPEDASAAIAALGVQAYRVPEAADAAGGQGPSHLYRLTEWRTEGT